VPSKKRKKERGKMAKKEEREEKERRGKQRQVEAVGRCMCFFSDMPLF
jgi:hypothetical protein